MVPIAVAEIAALRCGSAARTVSLARGSTLLGITPPTAPKTSASATTDRRAVSNGTFSRAHSDISDRTDATPKPVPVPAGRVVVRALPTGGNLRHGPAEWKGF